MPKRPKPTLVPTPGWRSLLRLSSTGAPIADLANALIILRNVPEFAVAFAFDEMQQQTIVRAHPPKCVDASNLVDPPRFANEQDVTQLQEWLQVVALPRIGREHVYNALEEFARGNPVHPLRQWLETREIGVRESVLENWLTFALGVPNDAYHRLVGQMFAVAMVARVFEPGCQCDYMLVLEGPQGELKSQFCRVLASDAYFSEHMPQISGGDQVRVSMHLRGKWLIEVSELASFTKAEVEPLKAFITRREEIYTPKFGRKETREPRQCLFIGTTNTDDWIKDETGGRRFWPVRVERVDLDWLAKYRDQLFAEAVQAYHAGVAWWPDPNFERRVITPRQAKAQAYDAWEDKLAPDLDWRQTITTREAANSIGVPDERLDMLAQKRIGAILRKLKWTKHLDAKGRAVWHKPE